MLAAFLIPIALLLVGCGGERSFEPEEFVEEANREGAGLVLGESLTSIAEGIDVYALSFTEEPENEEESGHAHGGGGSLVVTDDVAMAREEFERCESAVSLTCYRAANVVLYFEGSPGDEGIAEVDAAVRALGSD